MDREKPGPIQAGTSEPDTDQCYWTSDASALNSSDNANDRTRSMLADPCFSAITRSRSLCRGTVEHLAAAGLGSRRSAATPVSHMLEEVDRSERNGT